MYDHHIETQTQGFTDMVLHFYKQARLHQLATYGPNGLHIDGVDQRQFVGGGGAYGQHAIAAYNFARRQISFRKNRK